MKKWSKRTFRAVLAGVLAASMIVPAVPAAAEEETENDVTAVVGDLLQVSVNGGEKEVMSLYSKGMYEGEVPLDEGENTYEIYLNGESIKNGRIQSDTAEDMYIRYYALQDKVLLQNDLEGGFKYPAVWVGSFSSVLSGGSPVFDYADWQPAELDAGLDYIGGGCYKRTFEFQPLQNESEMEYKIAFGGDWNHGAVPADNKKLTFPEGCGSITLWANTTTEETFDSITDGDKTVETADGDYTKPAGTMEMAVRVGEKEISLVQTGEDVYMGTILLEEGDYTYGNLVDGREGTLKGEFSLTEETGVTFYYNAADNTVINSVTDAEELADATGYKIPVDEDQFEYDGDDLGAVYSEESTTFKVWAPTASDVKLRLYAKGSSTEEGDALLSETNMEKDSSADGEWSNGIWQLTVPGDLAGTYYTYVVTADGKTNETIDIYAKAAGVNGERGMVVDLDDTDPDGWESDTHVSAEKPTDAVVWEVHVKDFSSDPASGIENRGKYLAFTEEGTTLNGEGEYATGIDYLKELGVNYVQLVPVFDQLNDETDGSYNWGYNPLNYNVPEGSYSTNPYDGNVRIEEFKEMVQALHEAGIGVIMDVVYNHVGGSAVSSPFNKTVPGYYFRQDENGNFTGSGTGCGNETASEKAMFRKYMIESVLYWVQEYHIDGFRFDLMGCHDVDTMNALRDALDELPGGDKIITYGEPWSAGTTNQPEGVEMATQANMKLLDSRIGAFNDCIRDALKGHVFADAAGGFVQGECGKEQPNGGAVYTDSNVIAAIQANANPLLTNNWAALPSQSVSYVSCHDNMALYDKLQYSVNNVTEDGDDRYYERDENLVKMNKISAAAILTSQGTVFFQAGEEFARTKGGDGNSYQSPLCYEDGKELNQINWSRQVTFSDLKEYYEGLIELRKAYAPFRAADMSTIENMTFSDDQTENLIAYTINSPGEAWDMAAVIMNSGAETQEVTLKAAEGVELPDEWNCVVNQESAGVETLETYGGNTIEVPAQTTLVLTYKAETDTENPGDGTQDPGMSDGQDDGMQPDGNDGAAGEKDLPGQNDGKAAKTGDSAEVFGLTAVFLICMGAAVFILRKKLSVR